MTRIIIGTPLQGPGSDYNELQEVPTYRFGGNLALPTGRPPSET